MRLKNRTAIEFVFLMAWSAGCSSSDEAPQPAENTAIHGKVIDRWADKRCLRGLFRQERMGNAGRV